MGGVQEHKKRINKFSELIALFGENMYVSVKLNFLKNDF